MRWLASVTDSMDMNLSKHHEIVKDRKPDTAVHRMRWLASITDSMDMNLTKHHEIVKDRKPDTAVHGVIQSQIQLST